MKITDFKVMTFDVVGTLIDFESGVLNATRKVGGEKAAKLSDDEIFGPYIRGRDKFYGRSSSAMKDVYLHMATELGINNDQGSADLFQFAILHHPAFEDSIEAPAVCAKLPSRRHDQCRPHHILSLFETLENPFHDSVTCDETGYANRIRISLLTTKAVNQRLASNHQKSCT